MLQQGMSAMGKTDTPLTGWLWMDMGGELESNF